MSYEYDLFTIGAGSGGVRASRKAAEAGARVGVAEERDLGGTCVNVGCVPKKLLVYASHLRDDFEQAAGFGWAAGEPRFSWPVFLANKNRAIERLKTVYAGLLDAAGVERLEGTARLVGPHEVQIGDRTVTARRVLVATGGRPRLADIPGGDLGITSNEAFFLDALPRRLVIVGGGYIGVEFAGIFRGLGADVSLVHRGDLFLRGFDRDLREALRDEMAAQGIHLRFRTRATHLTRAGDGSIRVECDRGEPATADQVLFAIGRVPNSDGLGLEALGVNLDVEGAVVVDGCSQTSVPWIYAIGDVTNRMNLTPVAIAEAMALVETLFKRNPTAPDYENVPSAVFSNPPIGTVGLTEEQARDRFARIRVYRFRFRPLKQTLGGGEEHAVMKLVVNHADDRVVGAHMIGPDAAEIIQGFAVAIQCGATKAQFDATVGIHPTSAEEFVTMRRPVEPMA
jgi:glutathione reductase (NADPH)